MKRNLTFEALETRAMLASSSHLAALPAVSIANGSAVEGNLGQHNETFLVSLSRSSRQTITAIVNTSDGSAIAGSDYLATNQQITFWPGQTSLQVTVPILGHTLVEPDETFYVTLSSPSNARLGSATATGTILNDNLVTPAPAPPTDPTPPVGTNGPVGPQAGVTAPIGAIILSASNSTATNQALLDNAAACATFFFNAGTYWNLSIAPLAGQTFIGQYGATLTSSTVASAFRSSAPNVTIENLTVSGYVPSWPFSAIHADLATGWTVDHVEVFGSADRGVTLFDGGTLTNSYIHDNAVLGVKVDGLAGYSGQLQYLTIEGVPVLIQNNVISHNNPNGKGDTGFEAGGIKLWEANNVSILNNTISDNVGDGVWIDTCRAGNVVTNNLLQNNTESGIYNEISNGTLIASNECLGNAAGFSTQNWPGAAGILIDTSTGVTVNANTVTNNGNGIFTTSEQRSDDSTTWKLWNVVISGNTITMSVGRTGSVWDSSAGGTSANVAWAGNVYVASGTSGWVWNNWVNTHLTLAQWQALD